MLNNVHLMPRWLPTLDKRLDYFKEVGSNPAFRVMLSSDPSDMIPVGILERQERRQISHEQRREKNSERTTTDLKDRTYIRPNSERKERQGKQTKKGESAPRLVTHR